MLNNLEKYLKHKKHNNLVFASCDDKFTFCLYVSLITLLKHSPAFAKNADIFVAGYNISKQNKYALESIQGVKVIPYTFPLNLSKTDAIQKFTQASFARYDCFALLSHYKHIIYLDSDVLVQKELLPVFNNLSDGLGLIQDPTFGTVSGQFYEPIKDFDMNRMAFNSGFMAFKNNGKWCKDGQDIRAWLYEKTVELAPKLFLPDQGIINLALEHFKIEATPLPDSYNCPASRPSKELKNAFIIHSTGGRKFWCYYYFDEWYKNYEKWINAGGSPCWTARKQDSKIYRQFCRKTGLENKVFFQLCPDIFKSPLKALRFLLKKLLGVKY